MAPDSKKIPRVRVFISYKSCDRPFAEWLSKGLTNNNIYVWFDEWSMSPGKGAPGAMLDGLKEADAMVLVLTQASVDAIQSGKGGVAAEVQYAKDHRLKDTHFRLIGVQIDSCDPPIELSDIYGRPLRFQDSESYAERLRELIHWLKNPHGRYGPKVQDPGIVALHLREISQACNSVLYSSLSRESAKMLLRGIRRSIDNLMAGFTQAEDSSQETALLGLREFLRNCSTLGLGDAGIPHSEHSEYANQLCESLAAFRYGIEEDFPSIPFGRDASWLRSSFACQLIDLANSADTCSRVVASSAV